MKGLFLMMGTGLERLSCVPAGNILALEGFEDTILKTATLCSSPACPPMAPMTFQVITFPLPSASAAPSPSASTLSDRPRRMVSSPSLSSLCLAFRPSFIFCFRLMLVAGLSDIATEGCVATRVIAGRARGPCRCGARASFRDIQTSQGPRPPEQVRDQGENKGGGRGRRKESKGQGGRYRKWGGERSDEGGGKEGAGGGRQDGEHGGENEDVAFADS